MKFKNKNIVLFFIMTTLTLSCTVDTTKTIPSSSPSSVALSSPSVSVYPSILPTIIPSSSTLPITSAQPVQSVNPNITSDIKSDATVNGYIYDDAGNLMENVTVSIRSLEKAYDFYGDTKTIKGSYVFRNVPVGVKLEIKASNGEDWSERFVSYVAKSNSIGNPSANIVNFGDEFPAEDIINKLNYDFLTQAPEIIKVDPPRNSVLKNTAVKIKFTFSKPVKKSVLEDYFILRYLKSEVGRSIILGNGENGTTNTDGPPSISGLNQVIVDKNSSMKKFTWDTPLYDSLGKEFTFSLSDGYALPTTANNRVLYGVSLRGVGSNLKIVDKSDRLSLKTGEFYTDAVVRAKNYTFYVDSDRENPYLESVKLVKNTSHSIIRLIFSKAMTVEGFINSELYDINNYSFELNGGTLTLPNPIISIPIPNVVEIKSSTSAFNIGNTVKVTLNPNIKDYVGNFLSQGVTLGEKDYEKEAIYNP